MVPVSASKSITTSYGYDAAGNQTFITDGNGNATWTTYNPWSLPESVIKPATTTGQAASQRTWTTSYDADGKPAAVIQPGGVSLSYDYDAQGNLTGESGAGATAATAARTFTYYGDGLLATAATAAGTDTYAYNADGDLTGATGPTRVTSGQTACKTGPCGIVATTGNGKNAHGTRAIKTATKVSGGNTPSTGNGAAMGGGGGSPSTSNGDACEPSDDGSGDSAASSIPESTMNHVLNGDINEEGNLAAGI